MSTFDPFLPLTSSGCACGAHRSQAEHNHHMLLQLDRQLQPLTVPNEDKRKHANGIVAGAVLRKMFPN